MPPLRTILGPLADDPERPDWPSVIEALIRATVDGTISWDARMPPPDYAATYTIVGGSRSVQVGRRRESGRCVVRADFPNRIGRNQVAYSTPDLDSKCVELFEAARETTPVPHTFLPAFGRRRARETDTDGEPARPRELEPVEVTLGELQAMTSNGLLPWRVVPTTLGRTKSTYRFTTGTGMAVESGRNDDGTYFLELSIDGEGGSIPLPIEGTATNQVRRLNQEIKNHLERVADEAIDRLGLEIQELKAAPADVEVVGPELRDDDI